MDPDDEITITSWPLDHRPRRRAVVTDVAGMSVQGTRRSRNEDAWGFRGSEAFVVADGMGGRPGGDIAAKSTVDALLDELCSVSIDWRTMFGSVNRSVALSAESLGFPSVGAVAIGMRCRDDRVVLAHVGDARAYRLRNGLVQQLTRDHSIAEALASLGVRRSESGLPVRQLAAVTSFFGDTGSADEFSIHELTPQPGDRIVLCSDGVHGSISLDEWTRSASAASAADAAELLVDASARAGATDDRTALVIDITVELAAPGPAS